MLVLLDNVQLDKNTKTQFTNRNRIKTNDGVKWLTVPVKTKGENKFKKIKELSIDETVNWRKKHIKTIEQTYRKSKYFDDYYDDIQSLILTTEVNLSNFLDPFGKYFFSTLGLKPEVVYASQIDLFSKKAGLVLEICQHVGANTYLSGPYGRDYLDVQLFQKSGIRVKFHDYIHPTYKQHGAGFIPYLSIIDLLFNEGRNAIDIITAKKDQIKNETE